jgi:hypothetical protein
MSIALPAHAAKTNYSTNIMNHGMNRSSSDRTFTHANDRQKKRGETHKHRSLEVAPVVVHKPMVSHGFPCCHHDPWTFFSIIKDIKDTKDTKEVVAPFDAKTILPESKAPKPISKLLESMRKVVRFTLISS